VFNPENLAKQAELVEQVRLQKQAKAASAKTSDKKADGGAAGDKTKKRRRESGVDKVVASCFVY
jgi:hypothetical protein